MGEKIKCLVAHPQMQHSMRLAKALKDSDMLHQYCTMSFYREKGLWSIIYNLFKKIPGVYRFISRCKKSGLEDADITTYGEFRCLVLETVARLDKNGIFYYNFYKLISDWFGKKVAKKAIKDNVDVVVMYDYTAVKCFSYLKSHAPAIKRVLDMSSLPTKVIDDIISMEESKGYSSLFKLKRKRYSKKRCDYFAHEIELANSFIAPSQSVIDALLEVGVKKEEIYSIPFGVDLTSFTPNNKKNYTEKSIIHFLFVGRMEAAKGIHYLMDAFTQLYKERQDFTLELVGAACGNESLFRDLKFVNYHGIVAKEKMIEIYSDSDVFVFPSLWEGCSLSLMEALASGLPVIATKRSGVCEFVSDGEQGFVINGSNSAEIISYATWFLENKNAIKTMGKSAATCINGYSWEAYFNKVGESFKKLIN